MVNEDYVSFEIAKLLKEKGFKHWCYKSYGDAVYHKGVPISFAEEYELKSAGLEDEIEYVEGGDIYDFGCDNRKKDAKIWAAPTLQMAMKWLREIHCVHIDILMEGNGTCVEYRAYARPFKTIYPNRSFDSVDSFLIGNYKTYEDACEASLKYCLLNLI